jgi:hypothetical protein
MASGTRGSSVPRFSTTGRATSLQQVLKNILECDLTSPLYLSVLQHFGGDEDKFNIIDYFLYDPDLDERVRDVLSHIFGEAHADGESDKLVASVTKQAASQHRQWSQPKAQDIPAADLRKMLSQRQRPDKPSVMINGVKYIIKLNDVMYQVSNHKQTTLPLALIDCVRHMAY